MKAVMFHEFGGPEQLQLTDIDTPQPAPSEVLVEVKAAGVNPVDWKIREGYLSGVLPHQFPIIPGWDVAGIVTSTGIGVSLLQVGDEIWSYCRKAKGIDARSVFVRPGREQLDRLSDMAENNKLRVHSEKSFPLDAAAEAQLMSQAGHVRGKLVLV